MCSVTRLCFVCAWVCVSAESAAWPADSRLCVLISADDCFQGRQEDAEEYLGFTLNGLHEEMLALKKLISPQEESE